MYSFQLVNLSCDQTDAELRESMIRLSKIVNKTQMGFVLSVSGWDDDERELWEIPETINLFKRLVAIGFISILEITTSLKEITRVPNVNGKVIGLGALEVWLSATGRIKEIIPKEVIEEFIPIMEEANRKCREAAEINWMPSSIRDHLHQG